VRSGEVANRSSKQWGHDSCGVKELMQALAAEAVAKLYDARSGRFYLRRLGNLGRRGDKRRLPSSEASP